MKITIWSDFVCPFCYIGEAHLKQALNNFEHKDKVSIEYKSFQLDPEGKHIAGLNYYETFAKLKGIAISEVQGMMQKVNEMAEAADIAIDYDKAIYANTFDAHRIFQLAKEKNLGNEFFERFYSAHFSEGANLEDTNQIIKLALEVGLEEADIEAILADPVKNKALVKQDVMRAQVNGVQGVPFYVFEDKYGVSGAQPVEVFEQVLNTVWEKEMN